MKFRKLKRLPPLVRIKKHRNKSIIALYFRGSILACHNGIEYWFLPQENRLQCRPIGYSIVNIFEVSATKEAAEQWILNPENQKAIEDIAEALGYIKFLEKLP